MGGNEVWEERPYLRSAEKCFFSLKSVFPKKCPKFNKRLIIIWEKGTFLFAQLCSIVARTWRPARREHIFLGTKTCFSTQKPIFCHTTPNFIYSPFVALRETVHFPSWDRFFDFSCPSYGCLRKEKWPLIEIFPQLVGNMASKTNVGHWKVVFS